MEKNGVMLDLHGLNKKHAIDTLDIFLDGLDAMEVTVGIIIHSIGSGVLKNVTMEFLKTKSNVKEIFTEYHNIGVTYFLLDTGKEIDEKGLKEFILNSIKNNIEISQIKNISIKNLFGCFNYNVDFTKNNVFVIHAPNGCGKSHFLKYVKNIFEKKINELSDKPFEIIKVETSNTSFYLKTFDKKNIDDDIIHNLTMVVSTKFPKYNYISDLYEYNFEQRKFTNKNNCKLFQDIMDQFFCFEKKVVLKDDNSFDIIYDYEPKYTNPSILKKGDKLEFEDLSSGEKFIIKLFYKLIFGLKSNSFVIIDEPELSLHVEWQELMIRNVVKIANDFDVNILIATHSPYIVNNPNIEVGAVEYEEE